MMGTRLVGQAWRGLTRWPLRSFFMAIGIVVGITVLTMVLAAGMGARERIMDRVRVFGLENLMVWAGGTTPMTRGEQAAETTTLKIEDAEAIMREVPGVRLTAPFARVGSTEIRWGASTFTSPVFGVTPAWSQTWDWYAERGEFVTERDLEQLNRVAIIGPTVVRELFGDQEPIGEIIQVGAVPFEVQGTMKAKGLSAGGGDMDNRVFVPLTTYQRRVANIDYLSAIRVQVGSVRDMDRVAEGITALLRERHGLGPGVPDDFRIVTPTEITAMVEEMQGTFNLFLILVAAISLVVGGVVVANIMLISVNERRREIGLRLAVGARRRDIHNQFLLEASMITIVGGVAGLLIGFTGSRILEQLTGTPSVLTWHAVAAGVLFSAAVGIIAGLHPARKAAELPPVDALRS